MNGLIFMEAFDWSHKQLNPDINRPDYCPRCGVNMVDFGWMVTPNRTIICLKCGVEFNEVKETDDD